MNILIETKNSPYTYIYVSREYYNGKCLNENRLGIGKSKDPLKRLKDHNSSSSKISVEVKFEIIYKTKEQDTFFHNLLKNKGYKQIKKEIFEGTENRPLTLTEVKNIIEPHSIDGPWIYKNNQFISLKSNNQFKTNKIKTTLENDLWEQELLNKIKTTLENDLWEQELLNKIKTTPENDLWEQELLNKIGCTEFKSAPKKNVNQTIKNIKPIPPYTNASLQNFLTVERYNSNLVRERNNLKTQNVKPKSLDQKWEDDLHQFHLESWLIGLPAQCIFQIIMINNKRFENDKLGFIILDFGIILVHALIQCFCYHTFKNNWIEKNNK